MQYSCDIAKLLTAQLEKFVTLNRHQLAGHVPNLDFWLAEVRHCLEVIDGYGPRFERLSGAQNRHTAGHLRPAVRPKRVSDTELREARRLLCEATYHFLVRCLHEGMIDEATLRQACDRLGIGVEASDLRKPVSGASTAAPEKRSVMGE